MATTDQVRRWYPDIVTNHAARGTPGYEPDCDTSQAMRVEFPKEGGGVYRLLVHPLTAGAWEVYARLMRTFGETVPSAGGTHNCRNIADTDWPSLHAYCVALDLPPNDRKSSSFINAVLGVRTMSGAVVWKNLASINDRMHDEITCSPSALKSGFDPATIPGEPTPPPDPGEAMLPLTPSSAKEDIRLLQDRLNEAYAAGLTLDGVWGSSTASVVKEKLLKYTNTNDPDALAGNSVNANMFNGLTIDWVTAKVPNSGTVDSTARSQAKRANDRLDGIEVPS